MENENALRVLLTSGLSDLGYNSFVIVPKKKLAANVAIASRLPISNVRSNAVHAWRKNPVRDVVEAEIKMKDGTLHLFDDHWKSKAGGARATERSRLESAGIVVRRIKEITAGSREHVEFDRDRLGHAEISGPVEIVQNPIRGDGLKEVRREAPRRTSHRIGS